MSISRNPQGYRTGKCHGNAKHPDSLVREVRALYQSWKAVGSRKGYASAADVFGLSVNTVRDWCTYRTRPSA